MAITKKLFLFISLGIFYSLINPVESHAQLGTRYFHADTISVTTSATDTTYSTVWEVATIYSQVDLKVRIGAPDVGSWESRHWFVLTSGLALTIGPSPNLKRIEVKTISGSGVCYIIGYKTERQF